MSTIINALRKPDIKYPDSDGLPMAENTKQFRWIVTIEGGLDDHFADDPNVFVAGDLFWYPIEGDPGTRTAPDTLVVFGRPKGDRGSYKQWEEDNIAPQVVFEILSSGNRVGEMTRKFQFYERFGVEEYYIYDPDYNDLSGWRRSGERLSVIPNMNGWLSPRLGVRFVLEEDTLVIYRPDGQPFPTFLESQQARRAAQRLADAAQKEAEAAQKEAEAAQKEAVTAQKEAVTAQKQAEAAQRETEAAQKQVEAERQQRLTAEAQMQDQRRQRVRLEEKLRELGIDPSA